METNSQTPAWWRSQAIKLGLGVIFTNPIWPAGGWSQGLCLDHAVWHSILTLTFGESTTLHSTGLLQCEGNTRDRISQVTEMSATSGLSQQGGFGWIKSTHSTHTAKCPGWLAYRCQAPLRLLLRPWRGAAPLRGAHRGREDLHGGMLRRPELWLALLQEVD